MEINKASNSSKKWWNDCWTQILGHSNKIRTTLLHIYTPDLLKMFPHTPDLLMSTLHKPPQQFYMSTQAASIRAVFPALKVSLLRNICISRAVAIPWIMWRSVPDACQSMILLAVKMRYVRSSQFMSILFSISSSKGPSQCNFCWTTCSWHRPDRDVEDVCCFRRHSPPTR